MKVYLLQYYDAHDTWTQGAYSSMELALRYHEENDDWSEGWVSCNIQEMDVIECIKDFDTLDSLWRGEE